MRTRAGKSEDFFVRTGLRQEDPFSTILFNVVLEKTIRSSKLDRDGDIMHKSHQVIGYAVDLAVIARSEEGLKNIIQRLIDEAWQRGLQVNEKKS